MWTILKVFIEFVTTLLLFYVLVFWPPGMWDLISPTRNWTLITCVGRWSLSHWTAREILISQTFNNNILRYYGPIFQVRTPRLNNKMLTQRSVAKCQSQTYVFPTTLGIQLLSLPGNWINGYRTWDRNNSFSQNSSSHCWPLHHMKYPFRMRGSAPLTAELLIHSY